MSVHDISFLFFSYQSDPYVSTFYKIYNFSADNTHKKFIQKT